MTKNIDIAILNYQMWFSWYALNDLKKVYLELCEDKRQENEYKEMWYKRCLNKLEKIIARKESLEAEMDKRFIPNKK